MTMHDEVIVHPQAPLEFSDMPNTWSLYERVPILPTDPVAMAKIEAEAALEKYTRLIRAEGMLSGVLNSSLGPWIWMPQAPLPKKRETP